MANIKSKMKSIDKQRERNKSNSAMKNRVRKAIRVAREALLANDKDADKKVAFAHSMIATAVQKGTYHPNKGARKSSRLDKFVLEQKSKNK